MDVRRRSVLTAAGAAGAVGVAGVLGGTGTASAAALGAKHDHRDPNSLRELAEKIGLRIGTAIIPQDINTPRMERRRGEPVLGGDPGQRNEMAGR